MALPSTPTHLTTPGELLVAQIALVRLLSGVHSQMQSQALLDRELFIAKCARVLLFRAVLRSHVILQAAGLAKLLAALCAFVRTLITVDAQMLSQIVQSLELFLADMALVLLLRPFRRLWPGERGGLRGGIL